MAKFESVTFTEQHRMSLVIGNIVLTLSYDGRLKNALFTIDCPGLKLIADFNKRHFEKESPVLLISIPEGNITRNALASKYNLAYVTFTINLVIKLIEKKAVIGKEITILTPYNAQYWNYNNALLRFHANRPVLNINNILLAKTDAFQGRERDIVINDLTIKDNLRFIKSGIRVNTALSRAKNGKYIIINTAAFEKNPKNKIRFLSKFITYAKRERIHYVVLNKPTSLYVVKGETYDRSVIITKDNAEVTNAIQLTENDVEATDVPTQPTGDAGIIDEKVKK
jgi:superfamily I DNA and/or RNA helicase